MAEKACNKCCHLKIQCLLVLSGARWGPKWKAETDMEEAALPKWLKPVVEVSGVRAEMHVELTMQEILLEHLELLADMLELFTKQLKETKRPQKAVSMTGFISDEVTEQMSWRKEVETGMKEQGVYRRKEIEAERIRNVNRKM